MIRITGCAHFDQTPSRKICNQLQVSITVKITGTLIDSLNIGHSHECSVCIEAGKEGEFYLLAFHGANGQVYPWAEFLEVTIGDEVARESVRRGVIGVFRDELGVLRIGFRLLM